MADEARAGPGAAVSDDRTPRVPRRGAWVLLPFVWSLWLLLALVPSLLLAPHLDVRPFWLTADAACAALAAAAAFFLVAVWPFWIALDGSDAGALCLSARALGRSLLELLVLLALAVPFALAAWALSGASATAEALAAAAAASAALGLGFRAACLGKGPAGGRWLVAAALLVSAGPLMVAYAAGETMHAAFPRFLEISPVVAAVRLAMDGWPEGTWLRFAHLMQLRLMHRGYVLILINLFGAQHYQPPPHLCFPPSQYSRPLPPPW